MLAQVGALLAVVAAAALTLFGVWGSRSSDRLPVTEAIWLHAVVTWPILIKATLGSLLFPSALADGSVAYTLTIYGPGVVAGVISFVHRLTEHGVRVFGPGLLTLFGIIMVLPAVAFGGEQPTAVLIALAMALPLALRSRAAISLDSWAAQARVILGIVISSAVIVALVAPQLIIGLCRLDKCSIFGETLISPITNNGNFFGVAVALVLPLALNGLQRWRFVFLAVGALILVEVSGSRAALLAASVVIATFLIGWLTRRPRAITRIALSGVLAATIVTALVPFPAVFATYRGGLWARARDIFSGDEWFGLGPSFWSRNEQQISVFPNYSPHNVWLELAVSGGFILVGLTIAAVWWAARIMPPTDRVGFTLLLIGVLAIGVLESPVSPAKLGLTPFALLLPMMIASGYAATRLGPGSGSSPGSAPAALRSRQTSARVGS